VTRLIALVAASGGLAALVLLPHDAEGWAWVRAAVAAATLAIVLRRRGAWLDALIGGFLIVLAFALGNVITGDPGATAKPSKPRSLVVLPDSVVPPTRSFEDGDEIVLIVVKPKRSSEGHVIEQEAERFEVRLRQQLLKNTVPTDVLVSIERGKDDESLMKLLTAAEDATSIHVKEVPAKG
jgi:hypothetical protein